MSNRKVSKHTLWNLGVRINPPEITTYGSPDKGISEVWSKASVDPVTYVLPNVND